MSSSHYSKLDNLYTKSEIDTLIENVSEPDNIGDHVTETQSANIANGSFDGLPIGSYWKIDGTKYRIMDIDTFYGYNSISTHHVVVVPDEIYGTTRPYGTTDNGGSYLGSTIKTYIENTYNPYIISIFGNEHILTHLHDLNNYHSLVTYNVKAWLMNSYSLDGSRYTDEYLYSWKDADKRQFRGFNIDLNLRTGINPNSGARSAYWLCTTRDSYAGYACSVSYRGSVTASTTNSSLGVRPVFLVY